MRSYAVRYKIEDWNKPPEGGYDELRPGVQRSHDDHGYADEVIVVSVVAGSMLLIGKDGNPTREQLIALRDMVDHYLAHHAS